MGQHDSAPLLFPFPFDVFVFVNVVLVVTTVDAALDSLFLESNKAKLVAKQNHGIFQESNNFL